MFEKNSGSCSSSPLNKAVLDAEEFSPLTARDLIINNSAHPHDGSPKEEELPIILEEVGS